MEATLTPREVWEKIHEHVRNFDAEGQAALFAENGVWELPFAPESIPKRIEGRDKILAISKGGMERAKQSGRKISGYSDVHIYETDDPEVVIAEFILDGEAADGTSYHTPYIQVLRVRNGLVMSLRDYFPGEVLKPGA